MHSDQAPSPRMPTRITVSIRQHQSAPTHKRTPQRPKPPNVLHLPNVHHRHCAARNELPPRYARQTAGIVLRVWDLQSTLQTLHCRQQPRSPHAVQNAQPSVTWAHKSMESVALPASISCCLTCRGQAAD
jgi:hypothetical protein